MAPLPYPVSSHFSHEFIIGVESGLDGQSHPKHPRGSYRAGTYIEKGRSQGVIHTQMYSYKVPDGSDSLFPIPIVGERIYVARWFPDQVFIGGWGFASRFSGLGDLVAEYHDGRDLQRLTFANSTGLQSNKDYSKFEIEAVNIENPTSGVLDLFYELTVEPQVGDVLKGRLDFVG